MNKKQIIMTSNIRNNSKQGLFIVQDNRLFTSDWHIFNRGIWKHENRFQFIGSTETSESYEKKMDSLEPNLIEQERILVEYDLVFYKTLYEQLIKTLDSNKQITEFYFLGDLFVGATPKKIERLRSLSPELYALIHSFFNELKKRKIIRNMIVGNHDDFRVNSKKKNEEIERLHNHFFDTIQDYIYLKDENILISHVPVNRFNLPTKYGMVNFLLRPIVQELSELPSLVNYHGHTHSNQPSFLVGSDQGITYINTCIDNRLRCELL